MTMLESTRGQTIVHPTALLLRRGHSFLEGNSHRGEIWLY